VTSWFDHAYPDYAKNRNLMIWDGLSRTKLGYNLSLGCYEGRCYEGHNGIDLVYRGPATQANQNGVEILAAAAGEIAVVRAGCVVGNVRCGGGLGNHTVINHGNGYFTLYAHMARQTILRGSIIAGQPIGIMGSTGNSTGPHLHFALYKDDGNGVWDGIEVEQPLDPFGWRGTEGDPWVLDRQGPVSHYLWQYPLAQVESFAGQQGIDLTDATQNVQIEVPPTAFSGEVTLEMFRGPVAGSPAGVRSVGRAFWLSMLEWLPIPSVRQANLSTVSLALDQALTLPITITATYTDSEVRHLNVNQLTLTHWDQAKRSWQDLPTQIDAETHTVTAQTQALGEFDLQAPLLCPADAVEPDDDYFAARSVVAEGEVESRLFDIAGDEDWFYLEVEGERTYIIETVNLAPNVDTVLELFSRDAQTRLAVSDNRRNSLASYMEWTSAQDNVYFVRVSSGGNSANGCQASYELQVTLKPYQLFLPLITK
jgi:murein DD-endopeptidase MepM/ murein hydrolase activator NlpD